MSQVEQEREDLRKQLAAQKQQCRNLLQQITSLRQEQQHHVMLDAGKVLAQFEDSVTVRCWASWPWLL